MNDAIIRHAVHDDLSALLALYPYLNPRDPPPDPASAGEAWSALLGSRLTTVFVAEIAGMVASSCTLAVIPNLTRGARPYAVIENVVTHPDHRRTGLGRSVLEAALQAAWTAGCYKVMLATGRPETIPFYESAGFERDGKTFFEKRNP